MEEFNKFIKGNKLLIGVFLFICSIPICFYVYWFWNHDFSNSPEQWAQLGDFIGGIFNPIIGIGSILILGYVSVKLGKDATDKQRELFLQEQKILAYQELISNRIDFNQSLVAITKQKELRQKVTGIGVPDETRAEKIEFMRTEVLLSKFNVYLHSYGNKYQHLFNYSFSSDEFLKFRDLIEFKINFLVTNLNMDNKENREKHLLLGERMDNIMFESIARKLSQELKS